MVKFSLWGTAVAAFVGITLLMTPGTSEAQRRGWRGQGVDRGWYRGDGWYRDYNRGWYGGWYGGLGYGGLGYVYRYPGYYYGSRYPVYSSDSYYTEPAYSSTYQSYYPADNGYQVADPNTAGFIVRVPDPNAKVWFENYQTQQRGMVREFTTERLDPNRTYTYRVRARWTDNTGRAIDQTRDVTLRAGQQTNIDFTNP
jgi:uncharacterized protein (TIGR03000 family)